jgi:hypothetical protein
VSTRNDGQIGGRKDVEIREAEGGGSELRQREKKGRDLE